MVENRIPKALQWKESLNTEDTKDDRHFLSPHPKQILIVSTCRSGSSFLGEIILSAPNVFYSYEPLIFLEYYSGKKMELIKSIFQCRFSADYLNFINGLNKDRFGYKFPMTSNWRVWETCGHDLSLCNQPEFVSHVCSFFPVHLIKVVRLRAQEVALFLRSDPQAAENWKIIHLVRDPRGVMASRANLTWCKENPNCNNAKRHCTDMEEDLDWMEIIKREFPHSHYLLKFEDLTKNTVTETKELFRFLQIPFSETVLKFLKTHSKSKGEETNPASIYRKTETVASQWRNKLFPTDIASINDACHLILKKLSYDL